MANPAAKPAPATGSAGPVVLRLSGLTKRFGQVLAADGVDLELRRGEVLALLGENGAGKTTLMNMLFGHYLPDAGAVAVAGPDGAMTPLPGGDPEAALRAGIGMVHQHFTLALNLSALDNIALGVEPLWSWRRRTARLLARVRRIMGETGLAVPLDRPVGRLSVGQRQRVEILKALYRDARILVLDEPTAVLTPQEADSLFATVRGMTASGVSVIFISHKLREVLAFADRIAVLRQGRKVGEMAAAEASQACIAEMMVGGETETAERPPAAPGSPVLALDAVTVRGSNSRSGLDGVSLTVNAGEIVGIAGVSGNGQGVLTDLLSGLRTPDAGVVRLDGALVARFDPRTFLRAGVGRIPEDRHHEGVVGSMSVAENLVLESLDDPAFVRRGFLRRAAIRDHARAAAAHYDIRGPGPDAEARLLSGGNIQKLVLARVFAASPRLIVADQPTRGLDIGAAQAVARRLLEARGRGAGVVLVSEDLDEVLALSDRIVVMHDGRLVPADTRDRGRIGLLMAGEAA